MRDPRASPSSRPERRGRRPSHARVAVAFAVVATLMTVAAGTGLAGSVTPIPDAGATGLPVSIGSAVAARPTGSARVPEPFRAEPAAQRHLDERRSRSGPRGCGCGPPR
jgi:hypothetical protein